MTWFGLRFYTASSGGR